MKTIFAAVASILSLTACQLNTERQPNAPPVRVTPPNDPELVELVASEGEARRLERSCRDDEARACWLWGVELSVGQNLPKNTEAASSSFKRGCELGFGRACADYAGTLLNIPGEQPNRVAALKRGTELKDPHSAYGLGVLLMHGRGVEVDQAKAVRLYREACAANLGFACGNLGLAYWRGTGVAVDNAAAQAHFVRGCGLENANSCNNLALMVAENEPTRAEALYQQACDLGGALGCENLAKRIMDRDAARAKELFARGCQLGSADACRGN